MKSTNNQNKKKAPKKETKKIRLQFKVSPATKEHMMALIEWEQRSKRNKARLSGPISSA